MRKLIDTNVFIDALRNNKKAQNYLRQERPLICSVITAAEIIQGARDKKEQLKVEKLLQDLEILQLSLPIGEKMLKLMRKFSLSHSLEIPDALIAATAIEEKLTLVTSNAKHFSFIKGLKLKDWS